MREARRVANIRTCQAAKELHTLEKELDDLLTSGMGEWDMSKPRSLCTFLGGKFGLKAKVAAVCKLARRPCDNPELVTCSAESLGCSLADFL